MSDSTYTTPDWFWEAIDIKPESGFVEVEEAHVKTWTARRIFVDDDNKIKE